MAQDDIIPPNSMMALLEEFEIEAQQRDTKRTRTEIATAAMAAIISKNRALDSNDFATEQEYQTHITSIARGAVNYADALLTALEAK